MKITRKTIFITSITIASLAAFGCSRKSDPAAEVTQEEKTEQLAEIELKFPDAQATESGLHFVITKSGSGETTPQVGNMVTAHYTGTLLDGKKFDSSVDRGAPFSFQVGEHQVIRGWDEAFLGMTKGEKRKLIIPSWLGYGSRATGPIPANSILIFDVELLDFK